MVLPKHIHLFTSIREHVFVKHLYASNGSNENKQSPTQRAYHRLHETPHILQLLNLVFFCVRTWRQHIYPFFFFLKKVKPIAWQNIDQTALISIIWQILSHTFSK